ncbi:hypothetical protein K435DRAFT_855103 [Dendrothele bispora CBS 962.96]|uniref:Uncharacterized protein n=1 Tax=Dendrothele bispora (strain CBS 962.96) TaxID=1314807 RepID=A0A4S8MCG0_DENBC|nr:hypothetical protein K435DRAFT_855103 [Dendrothele bispora CBS 962.96]
MSANFFNLSNLETSSSNSESSWPPLTRYRADTKHVRLTCRQRNVRPASEHDFNYSTHSSSLTFLGSGPRSSRSHCHSSVLTIGSSSSSSTPYTLVSSSSIPLSSRPSTDRSPRPLNIPKIHEYSSLDRSIPTRRIDLTTKRTSYGGSIEHRTKVPPIDTVVNTIGTSEDNGSG